MDKRLEAALAEFDPEDPTTMRPRFFVFGVGMIKNAEYLPVTDARVCTLDPATGRINEDKWADNEWLRRIPKIGVNWLVWIIGYFERDGQDWCMIQNFGWPAGSGMRRVAVEVLAENIEEYDADDLLKMKK